MDVEDLANGKVCDTARRVLERSLRAYHGAEYHGGAQTVTRSLVADLFANSTRRAFADADNLPSDEDIFSALREERLQVLGEGYHIVALTEPARRFVVKYAKSRTGLPPFAPVESLPPRQHWSTDHGVGADGRVHPAIWQHIRAFESYGRLTVPNRVYIADDVLDSLDRQERTSLDRYASLGIVRSMGRHALPIRPEYPDDFANVKQPPDGRVLVSVFVVQPIVTPLTEAIEHDVLLGDPSRARYWQDRYHDFVEALWGHGVSHLDFSLLNVGVTQGESHERLVIFDPHMGAIELSAGGEEIADPFSPTNRSERGLDDLLRAARDGSRWALWRIQESAAETPDVPDERVWQAADIVREFHEATTDVAHGTGPFSRSRFYASWRRSGIWDVNDVARAQLDQLLGHALFEDFSALISEPERTDVYYRSMTVHGDDGAELPQFRARLQVYDQRPLLLVTNIAEDVPRLTKHWGSLILPPELDLHDDPAIHYHLRDLLTGEVYVRSGEELARDGMRIGLAPFELHALQIEDIWVQDLAVEQMLATTPDLRDLVALCKPVVAAVGDIHGELPALEAILRDLRVTDSSDHWCADDATVILTGDVGHGPDLQGTFDFIKRLAAQADSLGGGIVWTLGNHDLYADKEGGQGGERSLGYALWPQVRDIVLHPDRAIGLTITAAYYCHGKIFVHGGVLPDVVRMAERERGARDAETVVDYINTVFRAAISTHDRVRASDRPHEIFRAGTSHAREPRLPGDAGYEPAGIFTPDLRELDHYRYHQGLLPQVVGHTASAKGRIRSSPGSRFLRDYIAIDVGRQHGFGNGGLFLTRLGWTSTAPGEPARLVEASALFRQLARECLRTASDTASDGERQAHLLRTARQLLRPPETRTPTLGERRERLYVDLPADQVTTLASYFSSITATGRCVIVTDVGETLTEFLDHDREDDSRQLLMDFLEAGGVLVFASGANFEWFYEKVVKRLISALDSRPHLLQNTRLILAGGREIYVHQTGGFCRVAATRSATKGEGLTYVTRLSGAVSSSSWGDLALPSALYVADSHCPDGIDESLAAAAGITVNVGGPGPVTQAAAVAVAGGYRTAADVIALATHALRASPDARPPEGPPAPHEPASWTFQQKHVEPGHPVRVQVDASGYVHAGVAHADGQWEPVFNVPLVPQPDGSYTALLPPIANAFTFYWTEPPHIPGRPGHWERELQGGRVFTIGAAVP